MADSYDMLCDGVRCRQCDASVDIGVQLVSISYFRLVCDDLVTGLSRRKFPWTRPGASKGLG